MNNSINNLSPLDGRYSKKVSEITELFSEKALIQKRFIIEIEWLLFVLNESFYKTIKISKVDIKKINKFKNNFDQSYACLLYTSPSPRDRQKSRMPSSA